MPPHAAGSGRTTAPRNANTPSEQTPLTKLTVASLSSLHTSSEMTVSAHLDEVVSDLAKTSETEDPSNTRGMSMLLTQPLNAPDHAAVVTHAPTPHHAAARSPALTLVNTAATPTSIENATFANTLEKEKIAMTIAETQIQKTTIFPYLPSYHSPKLHQTKSSRAQS